MESLSPSCNNISSIINNENDKKELTLKTTTKKIKNEGNNISLEATRKVKELLNLFPLSCSPQKFSCENPSKTSDGHIKRPCNNFMIFRKLAHDKKVRIKELRKYNQRDFSQHLGRIWNLLLTPEEKEQYSKFAKEVAEIHRSKNPTYKYQPKRLKAAWKQYNFQSPDKKLRSRIEILAENDQTITNHYTENNNNLEEINSMNSYLYIQSPSTFMSEK
ncbi:5312_t:CDS:2 [Diversispora eburnea]|uniref:5312_t:CDS:1 n=1 Tax=Diversispora eburnea TaxID=1213867 RepID=A0A9N9AKF7_9GLOM|nr:5312_t:CDS:2 [Diversispora eburnea]